LIVSSGTRMNERIKELNAQATSEEKDGFRYFDKEKFAELLIRDIMSFCAVSDEACDIIKKHYGVE
jgi:hypothetical protein